MKPTVTEVNTIGESLSRATVTYTQRTKLNNRLARPITTRGADVNKLSTKEFEETVEATERSLQWRIDNLQLHPDDTHYAAVWCVNNGVSVGQFVGLLFQIGTRILYQLRSEEREILWGMGQGPATAEVLPDDVPF